MSKLNPEDLDVLSFETSAEAVAPLQPIGTTWDPTARTYCFICPPITRDLNCTIYAAAE